MNITLDNIGEILDAEGNILAENLRQLFVKLVDPRWPAELLERYCVCDLFIVTQV